MRSHTAQWRKNYKQILELKTATGKHEKTAGTFETWPASARLRRGCETRDEGVPGRDSAARDTEGQGRGPPQTGQQQRRRAGGSTRNPSRGKQAIGWGAGIT